MRKYLEPSDSPKGAGFHIYGVGVDETMPPCIVERPNGRGDWLFMHFHDSVSIMVKGRTSDHPAGTFMIWKPGDAQYYGNPVSDWRHSWLHCHGLEVQSLTSENHLTTEVVGVVDDTQKVNGIFNLIYDEVLRYSAADIRILKNLFEIFVLELRRTVDPRKNGQTIPDSLIQVQRYIEKHYAKQIRLSTLAELAGLSVSHFCSIYKQHTGSSPIATVIQTRMRHAAYLLSNVNLSIADVAAQCGYDDPFQFSKLFKKHMGRGPRAFRADL